MMVARGLVGVMTAAAIGIITRNCNVFIINMAEDLGTREELKGKMKNRIKKRGLQIYQPLLFTCSTS
jgi:hypothetical protein